MADPLNEDELARWASWKRASDAVLTAVVADITAATGLSGADFSVLTRVVELGSGSLRQQRLSDELGWERSRLSRQLARMADRGLVRREGDSTQRLVTVTPEGRRQTTRARVAHAASVRRHLLELAPVADAPFWAAVDRLAGIG